MTTKQATVAEAEAQAETRTATPPVVPDAEDAPPTPTEPSPAQTPLVPPPGSAEGTAAAPEPIPATETLPLSPEPFADELPPDFWGDALEPPPLPPTPSEPPDTLSSAPSPTTPTSPDKPAAPAPSSGIAKPLEGSLQKDPRFVLLQELFPGHISDWHAAPVADGGIGDDGATDAPPEPETVELEEGLDADV